MSMKMSNLFLCVLMSLIFSTLSWGWHYQFASEHIQYDEPDFGLPATLLTDDIQESNEQEFYDIHMADAGDNKLWVTWLEFVPTDPETVGEFTWRYPGKGDKLWIGKGGWGTATGQWAWDVDPQAILGPSSLSLDQYAHPTITVASSTVWLTYEYQQESDESVSNDEWHIYAGIVTVDANNISCSPVCITSGTNNHINHAVAPLSSGDIIITWQEDNGGQFDIKLGKVNNSNPPTMDTPILISQSTTNPNGLPNGDWRPDVAVTENGKICVVWDSYISQNEGFNVLARWGDASTLNFGSIYVVSPPEPAGQSATFQGKAQVVCRGNNAWIIWEEGAPNWGENYTSINAKDNRGVLPKDPDENYIYPYNRGDSHYSNAMDDWGPLHRFRRIKLAKLDQLGDITEYDVPMDTKGYSDDLSERDNVTDLGIYYEGGMITLDKQGRIWIAYRHFFNTGCRKAAAVTDKPTIVYEKGWKVYVRRLDLDIDAWSGLYATSNKDDHTPTSYYKYQQRDGMQRMSLCPYNTDSITVAWDIGRTERDPGKDEDEDQDDDRGVCLTKAKYDVTAPDNPVAHWEFEDDITDGETDDSSGNGYTGTICNNPDSIPDSDLNSQVLSFDGTGDYVDTNGGSSSGIPFTGIAQNYSRTVTAWIRTNASLDHIYTIASWGKATSKQKFMLFLDDEEENDVNLAVAIYGYRLTGSTVLNNDKWYHVAVTYDQSENEFSLYVNGQQETSGTPGFQLETTDTETAIIGAFRDDPSDPSSITGYFDGCLDDVRIYDYALSDPEIKYISGLPLITIRDEQAASLPSIGSKAPLETCNVSGQEYTLTFGDLHRHSDFSRCLPYFDGSIEDAYRYGIDVAGLSFMAMTDHSQDMDIGNLNTQIYWRYRKEYSRHQLPGAFTPYFGYERGTSNPHYNFVFKELNDTPPYLKNLDTNSAMAPYNYLNNLNSEYNFRDNAMAIPHWTSDTRFPNWNIHDNVKLGETFMPLLEIYQGCRDDLWDQTYKGQYYDYYEFGLQSGLDNGKHIGVIADSDHLSTSASYACVWAEENSRNSIFEAMKNRRTYAATDKIYLTFTIETDTGQHWMGEKQKTVKEPIFTIKAKTNPDKTNAEIHTFVIYSDLAQEPKTVSPASNISGFYTYEFKPSDSGFDWNWNDGNEHYVYVKAIQDDDSTVDSDGDGVITDDDDNRAWSSPIWFEISPLGQWTLDESSDNIAQDSSVYNYDGILNGPVCEPNSHINDLYIFDGTDDYIEIDDGGDPNNTFYGIPDANSRSVTAWIKTSAPGGQISTIMSWGQPIPSSGKKFMVFLDEYGGTDSRLAVGIYGYRLTGSTPLNDGKWHHVAATFDQSENKFVLYADGQEDASGGPDPNIVTVNTSLAEAALFGAFRNNSNDPNSILGYFNGSLDDVRVYDYALSKSQIRDLTMLAHWPLNFDAQDATVSQHHGQTVNDPNCDPNGCIAAAIEFNGVDQCITVPAHDNLHPAFPFSISMWFKPLQLSANTFMIHLDPSLDNTTYYSGACMRLDTTNGNKINIGYGNGDINCTPSSNNSHGKTGTTTLNAGQWYHVVGVFGGYNDLTIYVNGVDDGGTSTGTAPTIYYNDPALGSNLTIGARNSSSNFFNGTIDDVRLYNRKLSVDEVQELAGID